MFGRRFARVILASTAIAGTCWALPAAAQVATAPPVRQSVDGNGVDLFLGTMNVDGPVLSAGQAAPQGMSYRKFVRGNGGWGDTMVATLTADASNAWVSFGGTSAHFSISGGVYTSTEGDGATLSLSGTTYTYTAADGTVAHFSKIYVGTYPYGSTSGVVTDVVRPSGETLTYNYSTMSYCSASKPGGGGDICTRHSTAYRIGSITSNSNYQLNFAYDNWDGLAWDPDVIPSNSDFQNWGGITGVAMTNTAVTGAVARPQNFSSEFTGGNSYYVITDAMSRVSKYRMVLQGVGGVIRPGKTAEDVTIVYDGSNRVQSVTNPAGTTTYGYADVSGIRTTTVTDPGGHATVYTFDIASKLMKSATNPLSKTTAWDYDTSGRLTKATSPEGNYTQYTYDGRGNVTETRLVAKSGSGVADIVTTAGFDASCGNVATCNSPNWTRDALGNQTDYSYDVTTGKTLTVTQPAATTGGIRPKTTYSYTTSGGVQLLTGTSTCRTTASCTGTADETRSTIGYNSNLLPTTLTSGAGDGSLTATTTTGYDDAGNIASVDGPLSGSADTTTYRYDADRELVGAISADPDGAGARKRRAVRTTYNDRGVVTLTEAGTVNGTTDTDWAAFSSQQQTATTLDAADRKAQVAIAAGGTTYTVTQYSYDADGRADCVAVRMKPATFGSLPAACTLTTGSGDADRIVKYTYDNADQVTKVTLAYGTGAQSDDTIATYTDNGALATLTDAEGNKTTYEYDGVDRLLKTRYPVATKGAGVSSTTDYEQLGYDANGNVTSQQLRGGTLTIGYGYDNLNRLTAKNLPGSEADVSYAYDLQGRLTTATDANSNFVGYAYDALGRTTAQSSPLGVVGMGYDLAGRRTLLVYPDNYYLTYDYQVTGELTTIKESGTTTLGTYAYDDLGRRTSVTRGNGVTTSYGYDAVSRLSSLTADLTGTTSDLTLGYAYNPASQISAITRSNNAYSWTNATNTARNYTSNGLNQYSANTTTSFAYDARGNLTNSGSDAYSYSSQNLLLTGPNSAVLSYDPLMRLYQSGNASVAASTYLYDGDQPLALYATASGTLGPRYVNGPDGELLVEITPGNVKRYAVADERGSIISESDASGNSLSLNTYDEYGVPGPANAQRVQYTGQMWLPELGMYSYKARNYSPTLGRFMQADPTGYGDGMNWYNYVGGDPVNNTDPSGLEIVVTGTRYKCDGICITDPSAIERFLDQMRGPGGVPDNQNSPDDIVVTATRPKPKPPAPGKSKNSWLDCLGSFGSNFGQNLIDPARTVEGAINAGASLAWGTGEAVASGAAPSGGTVAIGGRVLKLARVGVARTAIRTAGVAARGFLGAYVLGSALVAGWQAYKDPRCH